MRSYTQILWNYRLTPATHLRGVPGVHGYHPTTSFFRFVVKKLPEHPKTRISSRQGEVTVLYHKVECHVFYCYQSVSVYNPACLFVPEVQALILDMVVLSGNQESRLSSSVAAPLPSGQSALGYSESFEFRSKPAGVVNCRAVREGQQPFEAHIHTDSRVEVQFRFRVGQLNGQAHIPLSQRLLENNVFYLCVFWYWPVILQLDLSDVLDVEHGPVLIVDPEFTSVTVSVFQRMKPVTAFEPGKAWFLACLETTEESPKGFVQPPEKLLDTGGVQLPQCVRVGVALIPKVAPLVRVGHAFLGLFVRLYPLFQGGIIKLSALFKDKVQGFTLSTSGIETIFVGSDHGVGGAEPAGPAPGRLGGFIKCFEHGKEALAEGIYFVFRTPFLRPQGITYDQLPMPDRVRNKQYVPTDMPRQPTTAHQIPSATPPEAYRLLP